MSARPKIVWERVATMVGVGYLILALTPRLLSTAGVLVPLASFYWSLPGALLGCALYTAWTGLRGRRQSALGLVGAGAAGVLLAGFAIVRLPVTLRPLAAGMSDASFFGAAAYGVLCDLSAIVFLFACFLAAYVTASPAPPHVGEEENRAARG